MIPHQFFYLMVVLGLLWIFCRFCRKFSFEAICGMVSPSNPCCKGGERRWRLALKEPISPKTLF
jgi:hypothetical protein